MPSSPAAAKAPMPPMVAHAGTSSGAACSWWEDRSAGAGAVCVNAPPGTAEGPSCSAGAVEGAADTASPGSGCWASWAGVESEAALGAAAASGAGVAESSAGAEGSADADAEGAGVAEVEPAPVGPSGSSTVQPVMMRSGSVRVWPSAWGVERICSASSPHRLPWPSSSRAMPQSVSPSCTV